MNLKNNHQIKIISIFILSLCTINQVSAQSIKARIDSVNAIPHEYIVSHLNKSLDIFTENLEKAQSIQYKFGEAKALEHLGKVYYLKGKYDKSAECNLKALKFFEQLNSNTDLATLYGIFGYQLKRRDLPKAMNYMQLGIQLAKKNNSKICLCALYDNYGVLQEMNNSLDSAQYFYNKALNLKTEISDTIGIPYSLNNLAGIHAMKGDYSKALEYIHLSDEYRNKEEGNYGRIGNAIFYGELYLHMGKLDSAISKYQYCINISDTLDQIYSVRYCYEQLSKIYAQQKNYQKAFLTQQKYSAYKDSVLNIQTNSKIAELEIDYETEKKDRQLAENTLEIRQRKNQLLLSGGAIFILIIISVWIYRSQKLKRERMRRELAYQNKLKRLELEKKLADEKARISRELHDNIGSQLTFLISSMDNLCYAEKEGRVFNRLTNISSFGRNTLKELRNTIWAMKHDDTDLSQLILKLNELKLQINSAMDELQVQIINNVTNPISLSASQMLNIYRIAQESVQNTIKHAEAKTIEIIFEESMNGFSALIKDNGNGFDSKAAYCGNGLKNMKHRCEEAGGEFSIESSKNGTSIFCRFVN